MRRAIFADADRIMRPNMENRQIHQRCQPDRATRIIRKNQEAGCKCPQTAKRHPVDGGAHGMLANAEMEISSAMVAELTPSLVVAGKFEREPGLSAWSKIGRATDEPWHPFGHSVKNLAGRIARRHAGGARSKGR